MSDRPQQDPLEREFRHEKHIRRAVMLLETKRKRMRQELKQFLVHVNFLIPKTEYRSEEEFVRDAIDRLGDDAFAQLLIQTLQELK
ncbi:MAG: hypothetical protein QNJ38_24315 [Prochloraceae cyanobacterium]|nr:hypothetical protein [Prochloraceae cyanobacterium]